MNLVRLNTGKKRISHMIAVTLMFPPLFIFFVSESVSWQFNFENCVGFLISRMGVNGGES